MRLRMRMMSCIEMMGQTKTDQGCLQLQTTPIRGVSYANRLMEEGFQDLFCHHRAEAISPSSKCTSSPPPTTSSCLPSTSTQLTGEPLFHRHYAGSPKSSASICNALITAKPPSLPDPVGIKSLFVYFVTFGLVGNQFQINFGVSYQCIVLSTLSLYCLYQNFRTQ